MNVLVEAESQIKNISSFAERVANLHIDHPRVEKIWRSLDSIRRHYQFKNRTNSPRHRFITGLSGVGKTQMLKRYVEKNAGFTITEKDGTEIDIMPVIYVSLPDPFTIMELYQSIISSLGAPQITGRPTIGAVKRQAFALLEKQRVEMVILDEMDFILTSRSVTHKEAMSAIKHIANTGIAVICAGTPAIEVLRKLDSQHFRRYPPTRLERFSQCDEEFLLFLRQVELQLNPPIVIGLDDPETMLPQTLHMASCGLVGYITPIIQETFDLNGVFDEDFDENTNEINFVSRLQEAYLNIVGDVTEEDVKKMIME